jgi:predicted RNA binding protein YcfA (HicA-like mRNA interferase family)
MTKLPRNCDWKKVVKVLGKFNFKFSNVTGSHYVMIKINCSPPKIITIPMHKPLKVGTLQHLINKAGLSRKEFLEHYKS